MRSRMLLTVSILLAAMPILWPVSSQASGSSQTVTITMGEDGARMYYRPDRIILQAGVRAEIRLVNVGKKPHEWMVYDMPKMPGKPQHMWTEEHSYFQGINAQVIGRARVERSEAGDLMEVELKAGQRITVVFVPTRKGTFQMGCLLPEHWERGMKGTLTVR